MYFFRKLVGVFCIIAIMSSSAIPGTLSTFAESNLSLPSFHPQLDLVNAPSGFGVGKTWNVGPNRQFKKPSEVVSLVQDGDIVEIDAATYMCDTSVTWSKNFLTLRGVGGRPILDATNCPISGGKGIWNPIFSVNSMIVDNIEFKGAVVNDKNGAGIRFDGFGYLYITRSVFQNNENGVLLTPGSAADIVIDQSVFANNGAGDGRSHNMYIAGNVSSFVLRFSYSHDSIVGHLVKSRAQNNLIIFNRLADEANGNSSYNIDLPNGGRSYIIGNIIQQSTRSENQALLAYSAEGGGNPDQSLYIAYNTFINERGGSVLLNLYDNNLSEAKLVGNLISGIPETNIVGITPAKLTQQGNLVVGSTSFVNAATRDYALVGTSPAINVGIDPGTAKGVSLDPQFEYLAGTGMTTRVLTGSGRDIGALEFRGSSPNPLPPTPINGVCGSSSGATFDTAPTQNLCSVGSATPLTGTGLWLWSCLGQNGGSNMACSANKTASTPLPNPNPSCTLSANPTNVTNGQSSILNWTMTNTLSGTLNPGSINISGSTGSITVTPPSSVNTTYSLSLSGSTGSVMCSVTISATSGTNPTPPTPSCTLSANPQNVVNSGSSLISWAMINIGSGVLNPLGVTLSGSSGSIRVNPPANTTTTYTLALAGSSGSTGCNVAITSTGTITNNPAPTPPPAPIPETGPGGGGGAYIPSGIYTTSNFPTQIINQQPAQVIYTQPTQDSYLENRRNAPQATFAYLIEDISGVSPESQEYKSIIVHAALELWRYTKNSSNPEDVRARLQAELRERQNLAKTRDERIIFQETEASYVFLAGQRSEIKKNVVKKEEKSEFIDEMGNFMYIHTENTLNLRTSMAFGENILSYLKRNQKIKIIKGYGDWTKVASGDIVGFVKTAFLRPRNTADAVREGELSYESLPRAYTQVKHSGFIRNSPQLTASIKGVLFHGDIVHILDTLPGWYEIIWGENQIGYVKKDLIRVE